MVKPKWFIKNKQLIHYHFVKKGEKFVIQPNVNFNFLNYSDEILRIRIKIENSNNVTNNIEYNDETIKKLKNIKIDLKNTKNS